MIEDAPIVKETRKVRCSISEKFGHDPERYIDYLLSQEVESGQKSKPIIERVETDQCVEAASQC